LKLAVVIASNLKGVMAEAKISSDRWVLDADLEGQKEEQNFKVS